MRFTLSLAVTVVLISSLLTAGVAAPRYDIPKLRGIIIDGTAADWGARGFRVDMLATDDGRMKPAEDLEAAARLGWDEEGLLLLVTVRDNTPIENASLDRLWENDSVETFCSPAGGQPSDFIQVIFTPGLDPQTPELLMRVRDLRKDAPKDSAVKVAREKTSDGYTLEVLYPWSLLSITPLAGKELNFNVWVNDSDTRARAYQVIWAPRQNVPGGTEASHVLRLADRASEPVVGMMTVQPYRFRRMDITVSAMRGMVGKLAELRVGENVVAREKLQADGDRIAAAFHLPLVNGQAPPPMTLFVNGKAVSDMTFPKLETARAQAALELPFCFRPYVFSGTAFPSCDYDNPEYAELLLGAYTIKTTFYNDTYQPVTAAEKPGRYGAVIEVTPKSGRKLTLYRTLFRLPENASLNFFPENHGLSVQLPVVPWLKPEQVEANHPAINTLFQWRLYDGNDRDPAVAIVFAGMYEAKVAPATVTTQTDVFAQDRQWWVGLKRKLYGMEQTYPADFVCPKPKEGAPAVVLHEGTLTEAGMKADTVEKLDTLLTKWAGDSDQSFAVFIARHGVVVLDKAYGQRDDHPMTVTDKSWMASITKLIAGTAMMTAVDQGRVSLNDPIDKFFPAFCNVQTNKPITIRHIYTHTAGLWGHWGDEMHDFDQVLGWYAPRLHVGERYEYDGAGLSLGSKALELVTGEALPLFYKRHLLDPLGCNVMTVTNSSYDASSNARDLAKIAQMLLNKGAYGNKRFFSEATWEQMLPRNLSDLIGPTQTEYGMGTSFFNGEGLGKGTWGHGSASSSTIRIDPVNDLVVIMTRNDAGKNFSTYHPQFTKLVAECIEK